jgi:hypothetical protein
MKVSVVSAGGQKRELLLEHGYVCAAAPSGVWLTMNTFTWHLIAR